MLRIEVNYDTSVPNKVRILIQHGVPKHADGPGPEAMDNPSMPGPAQGAQGAQGTQQGAQGPTGDVAGPREHRGGGGGSTSGGSGLHSGDYAAEVMRILGASLPHDHRLLYLSLIHI